MEHRGYNIFIFLLLFLLLSLLLFLILFLLLLAIPIRTRFDSDFKFLTLRILYGICACIGGEHE